MADVFNTAAGFLQMGVLYATTLKYQFGAPAVIGIQVFLNLLVFGLRTVLIRNGITQTNMMYEALLALVLAVLYFWILLSRFSILESVGIWVAIAVSMIVLIGLGTLLHMTDQPTLSRSATLEVPVYPRYVVEPPFQASGDFNRYQLKI
jgi:ABC-type transport system involved in cytochrome c biogenesis permease subunit